jgi:hypothetical protein
MLARREQTHFSGGVYLTKWEQVQIVCTLRGEANPHVQLQSLQTIEHTENKENCLMAVELRFVRAPSVGTSLEGIGPGA